MKEEEKQKPPIVLDADTLVDPDAMMIELLYAVVADATMLRSCRLIDLACFALYSLCIHHTVIWVNCFYILRLF
jgi:hypothetical protein